VAPCGFHRSPNSLPTMTDIKNSDFFRLADTSPDPLVRCFLRSHVEWNQPSRTPTRDGWKVILAAVRLSQPLAAYVSRQKLAGNHQTRVSIAIRITVWPKAKLWQGDAVDDGGKVLEQICTIVTTSIYKNMGVPLAPLRTPVRKSRLHLWRVRGGRKRLAQFEL
jgi:hypothetical protein